MAFDKKPSTWIPNWTEDGTDISVPIASFPELTSVEADGTTGDIRKVLFAMLEELYQKWLATAAADRPSKMTITKSSNLNAATGVVTNVYTVRFSNDIVAQEVEDEPT
ncbi:MAG: hypothetical protein NTY53_24605 [Kiritimatiellaeota bacterium]|nr:hypothetical protein [Kiritimatiellota bacterium]